MTIEAIVGTPTHGSWVEMLKTLGPDGRTHRLSVVLASMLKYTHRQSIKSKTPLGGHASAMSQPL